MAELTVVEMLQYVFQADRGVLREAVRLSDMEPDHKIVKLAEKLRYLGERSARDVFGKSQRGEAFAGWVQSGIQGLSSDQWREVASQVMAYAEYKYEHSTI